MNNSNFYFKSRVEYLKEMPKDEGFYEYLADSYDYEKERVLADIKDEDELLEMALDYNLRLDTDFLEKVIDKITSEEKLLDIVNKAYAEECRKYALSKIYNQKILEKIALEDKRWGMKFDAIKRLESKDVLEKIAENDKDFDIKVLALKRLIGEGEKTGFKDEIILDLVEKTTNQKILANFAQKDSYIQVRSVALKRLTDKELLKEVISSYIGVENEKDDFWILIFSKIQELDNQVACDLIKNIKKKSEDWYIKRLCDDMLKNV